MTERDLHFSITLLCKVKVTDEADGHRIRLENVNMGTIGTLTGPTVSDDVRAEMGAKARVLALSYALNEVTGKHETTSFQLENGASA